MAGVMSKFCLASLFMWMAPIAILYVYNNNIFPGYTAIMPVQTDDPISRVINVRSLVSIFGITDLPPHTLTLVSGFVAVISVNVVIGFYIYMALKEPVEKHEPDPKFFAEAKASIKKPLDAAAEGPSQSEAAASKKEE